MAAPPKCQTLAEYVAALIGQLGTADPGALARMKRVVGPRRARIQLDDEAVDVWFAGRRLQVAPPSTEARVDGFGYTDRATVLDLLDGYLEVTDAIRSGRLVAIGDVDDVLRMFQAIEILLDAAPRAPRLQGLARDYRQDPCREPRFARRTVPGAPREMALLRRLDMLPEGR